MTTDLETTTAYEVWERVSPDSIRRVGEQPPQTRSGAAGAARDYNFEERTNAQHEMREVRRTFFVVKATTTREEVS